MFGLSDTGVYAEAQDGAPAAYYGVFPVSMSYHGQTILGAQSGDTMTSPFHQKKGLFTQLAKETYKLAADNKVRLVFGFPNQNSYPGFKNKLDWQFTGFLQNYTITNSTIPLCELAGKYKALENIYRSYVHTRISKYQLDPTEANISTINTEASGVKKDKAFFEYKMKSPDVYFVRIDSFTLLIKVNNHLQIGAVAKFDKSKLSDFFKAIKKLANVLGCRKTIFIHSKNYWLNDVLQTALPATEGMPIGFYVIDNSIRIEDFSFSLADFDTF